MNNDEIKVIMPENVSTKTVLFGNCFGFIELGISIVGSVIAFIVFKILEFLEAPFMLNAAIPISIFVISVGLGLESGISNLPWWKYLHYFKNFLKSQKQYRYKYQTGKEKKYWKP